MLQIGKVVRILFPFDENFFDTYKVEEVFSYKDGQITLGVCDRLALGNFDHQRFERHHPHRLNLAGNSEARPCPPSS